MREFRCGTMQHMSPAIPLPTLAQALGHTASDKRLDVLRGVAQSGSISQAAREVGVSYKAAWQAIDTLTNLSGVPLVDRSVGGAGGGGARLTPDGEQLLRLAQALAQARERVLAEHAATGFWGSSAGGSGTGLGLRTSMRNQLPVVVVAVEPLAEDGGAVEAVLEAPGGARLMSMLTAESADLLGLVPGLSVLAMCKATAVEVRPGPGAWGGEVVRVTPGNHRTEVVLGLSGGGYWVGFAQPPFDATRGAWAHALVAPSAVVIGLQG